MNARLGPVTSGVTDFPGARLAVADVFHGDILTTHGAADGHLAFAAALGQDDFLDDVGLLGNDRLFTGLGHFYRPLLERLVGFFRLQNPIDAIALSFDVLFEKSDPL